MGADDVTGRLTVEPGVKVRLHEGLPVAVEIDLNRAHIYDGNGVRLQPGVVNPAGSKPGPAVLVIEADALRRLARNV